MRNSTDAKLRQTNANMRTKYAPKMTTVLFEAVGCPDFVSGSTTMPP